MPNMPDWTKDYLERYGPNAAKGPTMKMTLEKSKGSPDKANERMILVAQLIDRFAAEIPDAARIEIDIEWPDGGRCKVEGRA